MKTQSLTRVALKSLLAGGIYYTGMLAGIQLLRRALGGPRVHVLAYHRVVPDFRAAVRKVIPALCTSTRTFEAQLEYLARHMDILDLPSAVEALRGTRRLSRDACVLTFDDGYRDTYTQAFPILRRMGLPATVFVSTGFLGTRDFFPHDRLYAVLRVAAVEPPAPALPHAERWAATARCEGPHLAVEEACRTLRHRMLVDVVQALENAYGRGEPPDEDGHPLTWEMCEAMAQAGIEIASHTVWHTPLAHEPQPDMVRALAESKAAIEKRLLRPMRYLAYPNGLYSDAVIRACEELGLEAAVTTEDRPNQPGRTHLLRLGRKLLWEAHGRGLGKGPSRALVASHLENVYADLGLAGPVPGRVEPPSATGQWRQPA